jgi:hypothetical protein
VNIKIQINIILSVPLRVSKFGLIYLKGENRLWVFEFSVLSKTFGPQKEEVAGKWRKVKK